MDFKIAKEAIRRVAGLLDRMESSEEPSVLERDLALQHLREAYDALLSVGTETPAAGCAIPAMTAGTLAGEPEDELSGDDECSVEFIFSDEADDEVPAGEAETERMPEPAADTVPAPEPGPAPEVQPEIEKETVVEPDSGNGAGNGVDNVPVPALEELSEITVPGIPQQSLFGDEIPVSRPVRRSVLMSLYGDGEPPCDTPSSAAVQPAAEPVRKDASNGGVEPTPVVMQTAPEIDAVLGDVLGAQTATLGDTIPQRVDIAGATPVVSLRTAIGINDRFLLVRELFAGDIEAYDRAIDALDAQTSLDDCMIYIVEHYSWHGDSDGAKLIMELLQRKFR